MKTTMNADTAEDREANLFAMALLMPEDLIRREVKLLGRIDLCEDNSIKPLTDKFKVSTILMTIRLVQLGIIKL